MANKRHVVVLHYGIEGVKPVPEPVYLDPNDSLIFEPGEGTANGKIRVTFETPAFFSRQVYEQADPLGDIVVTAPLPGPVHYKCELLVNGNPLPQLPDAHGGTGQPGGGGGSSHSR